ncbi:unnamed protein product [Pedinophyceae sp. YPF-701]|nr:unnamed protein product [Pedinophyceae sp. YPF-701]
MSGEAGSAPAGGPELSAAEKRRQRILARGKDRLAKITGAATESSSEAVPAAREPDVSKPVPPAAPPDERQAAVSEPKAGAAGDREREAPSSAAQEEDEAQKAAGSPPREASGAAQGGGGAREAKNASEPIGLGSGIRNRKPQTAAGPKASNDDEDWTIDAGRQVLKKASQRDGSGPRPPARAQTLSAWNRLEYAVHVTALLRLLLALCVAGLAVARAYVPALAGDAPLGLPPGAAAQAAVVALERPLALLLALIALVVAGAFLYSGTAKAKEAVLARSRAQQSTGAFAPLKMMMAAVPQLRAPFEMATTFMAASGSVLGDVAIYLTVVAAVLGVPAAAFLDEMARSEGADVGAGRAADPDAHFEF